MKNYEHFFWAGLIALVVSCIGVGVIALKSTSVLGPRRSLFSNLKSVDIKIIKISAILFLVSILSFGIGFWFETH